MLSENLTTNYILSMSIKYVTLFLTIFDPPPPCHKLSQILDPLKSMSHFWTKVKQISRRMETALNNYNRYYYILNDNNGCLSVSNEPRNKPWNTLTSLISYNSEGDSCSLNLYYAW